MTFMKNKENSKSTIGVPRNKAKTCPKLTETSKRHELLQDSCCQICTCPTPNEMLLVYTLNRNCRVYVQLVFKNFWRSKKVHTKCKCEKIPEVDSASRNICSNGASC